MTGILRRNYIDRPDHGQGARTEIRPVPYRGAYQVEGTRLDLLPEFIHMIRVIGTGTTAGRGVMLLRPAGGIHQVPQSRG